MDRNSNGEHQGYQCQHCKGALLIPEDIDISYF
jgi:hypothetical protein